MSQPSPEISAWLVEYNARLKALQADGFVMTPATTRDGLARLTASMTSPGVQVDRVIDSMIGGDPPIAVRVYHPQPDEALPVLMYCHGGGHMAGSVDVYDPICRKLALTSRHIVIAPEYRLAPEHPYPAALQDAERVLRNYHQILEKLDVKFRKRLCIGGDSGGGAMCASLAHALRHDADVRIDRQVLIYPSLDYTMQQLSVTSNGHGYFLHADRMQWLFDHYFQHAEDRQAASPLYMEMDGQLPQSLIITAQFCPLRDEGIAYVERLQQAGIRVQHLHFNDMIHAFLNLEAIAEDACQRLYDAVGEFLNRPEPDNAAKGAGYFTPKP